MPARSLLRMRNSHAASAMITTAASRYAPSRPAALFCVASSALMLELYASVVCRYFVPFSMKYSISGASLLFSSVSMTPSEQNVV